MSQSIYKFEIPGHHKSIIKVIGVGGGGSNAVNFMFGEGIKDVEFVVCNTDVQALKSSPVPNKLQIGVGLTDGLGAGANPERGRSAAIESKEAIRELLSDNTKMVFITAGMGGGTGTGAAPIIAKIAQELDILTVGIVTAPFGFEGRKKKLQAEQGIAELKQYCDTVLIILNDKLREIYGNLAIREAFGKADDVLCNAAKSIAEIITVTSDVNVDFEDVKTVMKASGAAVMGSSVARGEKRAIRAAEEAISSPLLNNTDIHGAQKVLLSISSGDQAELSMDELTEITDYIQERVGDDSDMIFGQGIDPELGDAIRVTVIATGFTVSEDIPSSKKVIDLDSSKQINLFDNKTSPVKKDIIYTFEKPFTGPENKSQEDSFTTPNNEIIYRQQSENSFEKEEKKDEVVEQREYIFEIKSSEPKNEIKPISITEENKDELREKYQERMKRFSGLSMNENMNPEEFKHKLDVPAYQRKNVNLPDYPHSSERNVSRFTLNEENEILGNNKFLHDNVD